MDVTLRTRRSAPLRAVRGADPCPPRARATSLGRMSSRRNGKADSAAAPRTLAEELRARPDETLAALLRSRPDLLHPVPSDLTQLSTRLSTRASVVRALERLDRFTLQTAEALAVAPDDCTRATLTGLLDGATD